MRNQSSHRARRTNVLAIVALLVVSMLSGRARADFKTMGQRLPAETNVVVAVNVAKLLASPYGQQHQWAENLAEKWQSTPMMVPPGVKQLLMAADLDTKKVEPAWQVCLMEMLQMPSLDSIAQAHRGSLDRVWDKNAIMSPQNVYFVPLDDKTMASISPANRRVIAKWVRDQANPQGAMSSAYLKTLILALSENTDVVMALDLEGVFAVPRVRAFLDDTEIPEMKGKDLDAIARMFGNIKGIALNVAVENDIMARATATFDQDATVLDPVAKPLMIEILKHVGMHLPDLNDWKFTTSGKTVAMEGKLSEDSLRKMLGVVQSPIPTAGGADSMASQGEQGKGNAALDPGVASQKYYKFICQILDNLSGKNSLAETSTWLRNSARRIETAPIMNVDPALVEWGAMVTTKLKETAAVAAVGSTQTMAQSAAMQSSAVDYGAYTYDASGNFYSKVSAEGEANRQQRRQAAAQQKAQSQQQALQILDEIPVSRAKIRAEMTQKYKIEF